MSHSVIDKDLTGVSDALKDSVKPLHGGHVFLTGGTGFIGKWLIESFLRLNKMFALDARLTVLSRDPRSFLSSCPWFREAASLAFVQGDVRDYTAPHGTSDFIIHAATEASAKTGQDDPAEMYSVIVDGTRHVLDFAQRCSAKKLLHISSGAVYGPQPATLSHIPESYEGSPATSYGKGKKLSERLCLDASAGRFECVIARPFAFVGPYLPLDAHFAIGNFISDCLEDRPIVIRGDGTPLRSYLYAADLAEWLWTILLRGDHGRAYNVGSCDAISISDLARLVCECAGTDNEIIVQGEKTEGALPARYVPSVERAEKELALGQRYSLSDSICRTISWHRKAREKGLLI